MDKWIHNVVINNVRKGKIAENDAEIYEYGYTLMVEKIIIYVICGVIALILGAVWEVLALCITFIPLRIYAGGYHAKSRWGCMVLSGMFLVLGVLGARIVENYVSMRSFLIIELISALIFLRYAPVDIEEKRITSSESRYFKRRVLIVAGAELLLGILFFCFDRYSYAVIILVSNLLGICSVIGGLLSGKTFMYRRIKHDFGHNNLPEDFDKRPIETLSSGEVKKVIHPLTQEINQ